VNSVGPVSLVIDLRITHDRYRSSFDPSLKGHLHHRNHIDRSLNETTADKIRNYRTDYKNNPLNTVSLDRKYKMVFEDPVFG
jgi:hypothetical protein